MIIRLILNLILFLGILFPFHAFGSHLRAGEITARQISCDGRTFEITVTVFIDMESGIKFGGEEDWLNFGDGDSVLIPVTETIPRPDLGPNIGMARYTLIHSYTGLSTYTISYSEPFRNAGIVNIDRSGSTKFYIQTEISLDAFLSCNKNLPELLVPPIDKACVGQAFYHNPGAFDADGDSLSFELVIPKQSKGMEVFRYTDPSASDFYIDYEKGNEQKNGPPDLTLDSRDGTIVWNAPGMAGEYNIAFRIIEWRQDGFGNYHQISYVTRDMQIIVEDCENRRPDLLLPEDLCVTAGTLIEEVAYGTDPDNHQVKIEVFSEILNQVHTPATYTPFPPVYQPSNPQATLRFQWQTDCDDVKEQSYQVVFKITDRPQQGVALVTFKTWRIKVVAPAPEWQDIKPGPARRTVSLTWDPYECEEAHRMQVWRKAGGSEFNPGLCETGMPALGYELVSTVRLRDSLTNEVVNQFTDTNGGEGLAPGATYCYRLVAIFPDPKGGESYVSRDTCLAPIPADAPVITHVTVERTHSSDGRIRISWQRPFDLDRTQFPGPYRYSVYRANGFSGTDAILADGGDQIDDTTFVDGGLDTENSVFNYRIVLYSNTSADPATWSALDTSAIASSVRLNAEASESSISLTWRADVPWTNVSGEHPYHLIYRADDMDPQNFVLIDSVHSAGNNFTFTDAGEYGNAPLETDRQYCYRVLTRGTYENPFIIDPLENFSQAICARLNDLVKPCPPVVTLTPVDCENVFLTSQCLVSEFSNRIQWSSDCDEEVKRFRVYAAFNPDGPFTILADNLRDTFFIHSNLPSYARCYKVTSVDAHGNESEFSETVCSDNCPYFELPNVFTPNDDDCNDFLSAFGPFNPLHETAPESCIPSGANYAKCIRFVKRVSFSVFNRWGKEVYTMTDRNGENNQYINWDGLDNHGKELSAGVYFYIARVTFDVMDPDKKEQTFKGWVHLVR